MNEFDRMRLDSRIESLRAAANEAHRFVVAASEAFTELQDKRQGEPSKAYAAAKRASLDLTNALVRVRRRV